MLIILLAADAVSVTAAFLLAVISRAIFGGIYFPLYWDLVPYIFLILIFLAMFGLYSTFGTSPADEIRRIFLAVSLILMVIGFFSFFFRGGWEYSRIVFFLFWFYSIPFLMLGRYLARTAGASLNIWGVPVVMLSDHSRGMDLTQALIRNRKAGLRPVAYLTPDGETLPSGGFATGAWESAEELRKEFSAAGAVVTLSSSGGADSLEQVYKLCENYPRLFIVADILGETNLWVKPVDIMGNLGLEIKQNLDTPGAQFIKRSLDLVLSLCLVLLLLPFFGLIILAIRADSPGKALYGQMRIGKNHRPIRILKFRTMFEDADARLASLIGENEALRKEWDEFQKMKEDPRVTRVGRWLRRWSLDELPQIWNVLKGEMSLIGPRPMTIGQEESYGRDLDLYMRVQPGLTGLWQVSGRNTTTFQQRAVFDAYYVRNWSIWLDLYIMAKTPLVILKGEGVF